MRVVKAIKLRLTSKINHCFKKKLTLGLSTSCMQSLEKKKKKTTNNDTCKS